MHETSSSFGTAISHVGGAVSLSEIISALTFALDLTEGAVPGHALRSCLLGMRLAEAMGVSEEMRVSLYYALQLKDIGCSSNASKVTQITGGDDRVLKAAAKLTDWTKPRNIDLRALKTVWRNVLPGSGLRARLARLVRMACTPSNNTLGLVALRCDRGAEILLMLEMGEDAAEAVRRLDEHWDGGGYPDGLRGEEIPLLARICLVAQDLDVFSIADGPEAAMRVLRKRTGGWFDPEIVHVAERLHATGELWKDCGVNDDVEQTRRAVLELDPGGRAELVPERLDRICEAFASVVDAKSPFTYRHSISVADVAVQMAEEMNLEAARVQLIRRAALLHDLGKLRVPNTILDKHGELTPDEWTVVLQHPGLTRSILERVSSFRELAAVAAEHHERLDGSGYPLGLKADDIAMESRLLALADMFTALVENRPYREGLDTELVFSILREHVPQRVDATCFAALQSAAARWEDKLPACHIAFTVDAIGSPSSRWNASLTGTA
jgi:putative nucleotidyltransferase with HDIG domain